MAWDPQRRGGKFSWPSFKKGKDVDRSGQPQQQQLSMREALRSELKTRLRSITEDELLVSRESKLSVRVTVRFVDPAVKSTYSRSYDSSPSFEPSQKICRGLLRRIEHCSTELITRGDSRALVEQTSKHEPPRRLRYEMTFQIFRRGTGLWVERTFKSYQKQPLTNESAREIVLSTHRMIGLFLRRHDQSFKWIEGAASDPFNDRALTQKPVLDGPQSLHCVPRSRFLDSIQAFEFIPGYTIELAFRSSCPQRKQKELRKTIRVSSRQNTPLNLHSGDDLLWRAFDSVHGELVTRKRMFERDHRNCDPLDAASGCQHFAENAMKIDLRISNNLGPAYDLHRSIDSSLMVFRREDGGDACEFLHDVEGCLSMLRDQVDGQIDRLNDFELQVIGLSGRRWGIEQPMKFVLDSSAWYSRRSVEAILDRVQTGIADVIRGHDVQTHFVAFKRGHLVLDKALRAHADIGHGNGSSLAEARAEKADFVTRLRARVQQDLDMICKDTCCLDDLPEVEEVEYESPRVSFENGVEQQTETPPPAPEPPRQSAKPVRPRAFPLVSKRYMSHHRENSGSSNTHDGPEQVESRSLKADSEKTVVEEETAPVVPNEDRQDRHSDGEDKDAGPQDRPRSSPLANDDGLRQGDAQQTSPLAESREAARPQELRETAAGQGPQEVQELPAIQEAPEVPGPRATVEAEQEAQTAPEAEAVKEAPKSDEAAEGAHVTEEPEVTHETHEMPALEEAREAQQPQQTQQPQALQEVQQPQDVRRVPPEVPARPEARKSEEARESQKPQEPQEALNISDVQEAKVTEVEEIPQAQTPDKPRELEKDQGPRESHDPEVTQVAQEARMPDEPREDDGASPQAAIASDATGIQIQVPQIKVPTTPVASAAEDNASLPDLSDGEDATPMHNSVMTPKFLRTMSGNQQGIIRERIIEDQMEAASDGEGSPKGIVPIPLSYNKTDGEEKLSDVYPRPIATPAQKPMIDLSGVDNGMSGPEKTLKPGQLTMPLLTPGIEWMPSPLPTPGLEWMPSPLGTPGLANTPARQQTPSPDLNSEERPLLQQQTPAQTSQPEQKPMVVLEPEPMEMQETESSPASEPAPMPPSPSMVSSEFVTKVPSKALEVPLPAGGASASNESLRDVERPSDTPQDGSQHRPQTAGHLGLNESHLVECGLDNATFGRKPKVPSGLFTRKASSSEAAPRLSTSSKMTKASKSDKTAETDKKKREHKGKGKGFGRMATMFAGFAVASHIWNKR